MLSKSTYLRGLQCEKSLWLNRHMPEIRDVPDPTETRRMQSGKEVGETARGLFPGGVAVWDGETSDLKTAFVLTADLVRQGTPVIYEAAFHHDGVNCIVDILVRDGNAWKIYEVKSSTELKEEYLDDVAIQHHVLSGAGLPIKDSSVVFINNQYMRNGDIDLLSLFVVQSILNDVIQRQGTVRDDIARFKDVLRLQSVPDIGIGPCCDNPYSCNFRGHCWEHIPAYSIFDISGLRGDKKFALCSDGIILIEDLPDDFPLNDKQRVQVDCHKQNKEHLDLRQIRSFVESVSYPLSFLDFETFQQPIPLFDNIKPYQQIPFQYSLHGREAKGVPPTHKDFLAVPGHDPRPEFIHALIADTEGNGDIIVYNQAFEKMIIKELIRDFPDYADVLQALADRFKDLMAPFKGKHYYTNQMKGSASLKQVLPAVVPTLDYSKLAIQDGAAAMSAYHYLQQVTDKAEAERIRRDLIEYCRMDTHALVEILGVLEGIAGE